MRAEQDEAERKATYDRRKAEERSRAEAPASEQVSDAWKSLGVVDPEPSTTFEAKGRDANAELQASGQSGLAEAVSVNDDDVLDVDDLVQVRQDKGVRTSGRVHPVKKNSLETRLPFSTPSEGVMKPWRQAGIDGATTQRHARLHASSDEAPFGPRTFAGGRGQTACLFTRSDAGV